MRALISIGILITAFLLVGCGGKKPPASSVPLIMDMTPDEFWQRFNGHTHDDRLKLGTVEVTEWSANGNPKYGNGVVFYPQSFRDVGISIACDEKSQGIKKVTVFAELDGKNEVNFHAAIAVYRVAIKALNSTMSDNAVDGVLKDLEVNELPPAHNTGTQRDFWGNGVVTQYKVNILQQTVGERSIELGIYNAKK